jgi:hypothetical protein
VALSEGWELALWALALVIVIQQFDSNVIIPLVAGHAVRLPPAVGLFAVIATGVPRVFRGDPTVAYVIACAIHTLYESGLHE